MMSEIKFYREINFKETPIGKIPENWEVDKLEDVVEIHDSKRIPLSEMERSNRKGPYPYCGANGIIDYIDDYIFDGEFVLLAEDGGAYGKFENTAYMMSGKFWVNNHAHILQAIKGKSFNLFLKLVLDFLDLNPYIVGSTRKKLNQEQMREIKIPLPPFPEQQKIVEVLSVVDASIEKVSEVIAKTERLKKGLMQELLTKGIGHKEYKQTPIGKTPKTWEIRKVGEALELCQYGLSVRFGEKGKYPIVKMDDIVNGVVVPDNVKYVDLDAKTFGNFRLEKRDVLFNRTNSFELVGRTGMFLLSGDYVFASYLIRLRPKKGLVDSLYLTYYMIFSNDRLKQLATRAVHQANINATNLKSFKIPVPPFAEQQRIAETLSAIDKKLELERNERAKLERVKRGLMDLLLSGKVRVKVD